jgi:hypothetical protein
MTTLFLLVFGVASTALAIWVDVRFESKRPAEFRFAVLHVAAAWCIAQLLVGPGMSALADSGRVLGGIILVALPATIYCLLSMVWLMRVCAGALSGGGLRN